MQEIVQLESMGYQFEVSGGKISFRSNEKRTPATAALLAVIKQNKEAAASFLENRQTIGADGFHPVEEIGIIDGWRQIIVGQWRGIGLLDVLEPLQQTWGSKIIIAEPGRDRRKLQACYPGMMIFEPNEFQDAVKRWPDNAGVILAERIFNVGSGVR